MGLRRRWATFVSVRTLAVASMVIATMSPPAGAQERSQERPDRHTEPTVSSETGRLDNRERRAADEDFGPLRAQAREEGSVRVIAGLQADFVPEGALSAATTRRQRADIARETAAMRQALAGTDFAVAREYETVPYLALELSEAALEAMRRSGKAASVELDQVNQPALAESTPLVQADAMFADGWTGSGYVVAVLDTGVDAAHPFFGGRVVEEACFSTTSPSTTTLCPNGLSTQLGPGSAEPCTGLTGCDHGTHVAGIAAGRSATFSGVAPQADLMSVQVFSRWGQDVVAWDSDILAGLERVYALRASYAFAAANLSLGGGWHLSPCDDNALKSVIDNLRSVGIATVVATGNDGYTDAVSFPACISTAVAVGSSTKSDGISGFSNGHATMVDLVAPGSAIYSAVPGGGFGHMSGTSMAAPQVAGAWAVLHHHAPGSTVTSILDSLQQTGRPIADPRVGGRVHARIRIQDAAKGETTPAPAPPANDAFTNATTIPTLPFRHEQSTNTATMELGEPTPCHTDRSVWFRYTPKAAQTLTIKTFGTDPVADGSSFETTLAVYTGTSLGGLTLLACDDGSFTGPPSWQAGLEVPVQADTTYFIQAGGWAGNSGELLGGDLLLDVSGTAGPDVAEPLLFVPSTPCAVFDTRHGEGAWAGPAYGGTSSVFTVAGAVPPQQGGAGCVAAPAGARAVMLNLVAVDPLVSGNLRVAAAGQTAVGGVLNFSAGANIANAVPVALDSHGQIAVDVNASGVEALHVRGVVLGYYVTPDTELVGTEGLAFIPTTPCAVLDTRTGTQEYAGPVTGGSATTFAVSGHISPAQGGEACTAPPADAAAVMLNLVAVDPTHAGNLRAAAAGETAQGGVVNFNPGVNVANAIPVETAGGQVTLEVNASTASQTHLRAVLLGYFIPTDRAPADVEPLAFVPTTPCAVFDTRSASGALAGPAAGGSTSTFTVLGAIPTGQGAGACQAGPAQATALMLNLVAINATTAGNLRAAPAGVAPRGGVLNYRQGENIANAFPLSVTAGQASAAATTLRLSAVPRRLLDRSSEVQRSRRPNGARPGGPPERPDPARASPWRCRWSSAGRGQAGRPRARSIPRRGRTVRGSRGSARGWRSRCRRRRCRPRRAYPR
jgi:subtilisin